MIWRGSYATITIYNLLQVRDDRRNAEYLCLSYNPFVDVIGVGEENGNIKLYDENTLQVEMILPC